VKTGHALQLKKTACLIAVQLCNMQGMLHCQFDSYAARSVMLKPLPYFPNAVSYFSTL